MHVTPIYIQKHGLGKADPDLLAKCLKHVWELLQELRGPDKNLDEDRVAKSVDLDEKLKERLRAIIKIRDMTLRLCFDT